MSANPGGQSVIDRLPLGRFPLTRTRSLDEARRIYSTLYVPVTVEQIDRGELFAWDANRAQVDRIVLLATRYGCALRASGPSSGDYYDLVMAHSGRGEVRLAGRAAPLRAGGRAVMVSPSLPVEFEVGSGYLGTHVSIPRLALETTLSALTGAAPSTPLRFEASVDVASGAGAKLVRFVDFMLDEAGREGGVLSSPLVASGLVETLLHALLLFLPHNHSDRLVVPGRPAEPGYLRRAEEYLDANADRPVTSAELTAQLGMSVRSIQSAFRVYRGSTPSAFLRERRFELARRRLLSGACSTVIEAALACGFEHLGRFSIGYRARFGESPSETLRRVGALPRLKG